MSGFPAGILPLDSDQTSVLQSAVHGLSFAQLQWVSGYVAGLAAASDQSALAPINLPKAVGNQGADTKLTVLYGSQTGNGEQVAVDLVDAARAQGFAADAINLSDFKPANLKRESLVTFVISTHGEGDPPDDAELFHEYLLSKKAPKLPDLSYSVLALGDSSYVNFCRTGRDVDARLQELGARRFETTVECDLEYENPVALWSTRIIAGLAELLDSGEASSTPRLRAVASAAQYDKANPYPAEVLVNQKITAATSSKDIRHIELSLNGSPLSFEPGDALAVIVENPPQLVAQMLTELNMDGSAIVTLGDEELPLRDALSKSLEITAVSLGFLRKWAELSASTGNNELPSLLAANDPKALSDFVGKYQIIDVIRGFPVAAKPDQFVNMLRTLSPRSYSIASSQDANPDEVHLTVAAVRYDAFGSEHWGAASTHMVDRLDEGDVVQVFVEKNKRFRLPGADVPMIMIGAGTGVAPFRAFVEQRVEQRAAGENWLIFGERNFSSDFLYQLEWQRHLKQGNLHRLDLAFSRDQSQKIYVQDRIREHGAQLYRWIERGAAIYVCGDAGHMANDVNDALLDVFAVHGGQDSAAAVQQLRDLRKSGRYQRDVY